MKNLFGQKSFLWMGMICLIMVFYAPSGWGEELPEGFKLNASSIDAALDKTFEGHTIKSLLTEKQEWWIRNHALEIELQHSKPYPVDPNFVEATLKYAGDIKFDPKTRDVIGYKAGCPFPYISDDDPHKATKIIWNQYLIAGWPAPEVQWAPRFGYLLVEGKRGPVNTMEWVLLRTFGQGRFYHTNGEPVVDDEFYFKQVLLARDPYDVRGIGSLKFRYRYDRMDDGWVYVRSVRRTRRIAGGGWFDPIGGTDQLNDELSIYSAYPTWFPEYKYLGRRLILAMAHLPEFLWEPEAADQYPGFDLKNPPYWNPTQPWAPREVYVIEGTMPKEHVYSKRIYYIDCEGLVPHMSEAYDKKGEFTKMTLNFNWILKGMGGPHDYGVETLGIETIDWKRMHATIASEGGNYRRNPPGIGMDYLSIGLMEAVAEGKWLPPEFPEPKPGEPKYWKDFDVDFTFMKLK